MTRVFISYRQTSDAERNRVRTFAVWLRANGVEVILDQFVLETTGFPPKGWILWSIDQATKIDRVIVIGSKDWFLCSMGEQPPGTGLGAAIEARVILERLVKSEFKVDEIRFITFDDLDTEDIPLVYKSMHRYHPERDLQGLVRWLGGTTQAEATTVPNNLPRQHSPFFGRAEDLSKISNALSPKARTWGALIDGPGGIGKTSLAIRAAELVSSADFQQIVFVSFKLSELTPDGVKAITDFVITGFIDLLNEIASQLELRDFTLQPEEVRAQTLIDALTPLRILLILDNVESLSESDQSRLFQFLDHLPAGCKAIATSRKSQGTYGRPVPLAELDKESFLALTAQLAEHRPQLASATQEEKTQLYSGTGGNPLLLQWIAGLFYRRTCWNVADALELLTSASDKNDPVQYVIGNLIDAFSVTEVQALAALSLIGEPIGLDLIASLTGNSTVDSRKALRELSSCKLIETDKRVGVHP